MVKWLLAAAHVIDILYYHTLHFMNPIKHGGFAGMCDSFVCCASIVYTHKNDIVLSLRMSRTKESTRVLFLGKNKTYMHCVQ